MYESRVTTGAVYHETNYEHDSLASIANTTCVTHNTPTWIVVGSHLLWCQGAIGGLVEHLSHFLPILRIESATFRTL